MTTPLACVRDLALRLDGCASDHDALLERVGERPFVLLGEASHGTAEFYRLRAEISRRLIEEKGFEAVLVEADWPDALRLDRYVRGAGEDSLAEAFADFQRFPHWMWCNHEVRDFIAWLRQHNSQLARQRFGAERVLLVGFTTHTGHVTAARVWDGPAEHRWIRPSLEGSVERLFHRSGLDRFYLPLSTARAEPLEESLLERAIGVIYRPETERASHYFQACLAEQFDALYHLDETTAVEPLEPGSSWQHEAIPDTYPFGV